jgi:cell division protein FtsL
VKLSGGNLRSKKRRYYRKGKSYRVKGGWFKPLIWGLFLILFIALGCVWQRVYVLKLCQEVKTLKGEVAEVEKRYKYLNIEIASLSSRERIESIASNNLNLTYPQPEKIIYLKEPLITSPDEQKHTFVLWEKFKNVTNQLPFVTEEKVEAKEIRHDL